MKFIEMTGKVLKEIVSEDDGLYQELERLGVTDETVVRVNQQGDVEVRRPKKWDVVGGLIGNYEERIKKRTGLDWA